MSTLLLVLLTVILLTLAKYVPKRDFTLVTFLVVIGKFGKVLYRHILIFAFLGVNNHTLQFI